MLRTLALSVLGRAAGLALFGGGFWLLFTGFLDSTIVLGILGGLMIPMGMWVMALARRVASGQ
jgi:hypothetical protein